MRGKMTDEDIAQLRADAEVISPKVLAKKYSLTTGEVLRFLGLGDVSPYRGAPRKPKRRAVNAR